MFLRLESSHYVVVCNFIGIGNPSTLGETTNNNLHCVSLTVPDLDEEKKHRLQPVNLIGKSGTDHIQL